jgi:hypothetical protein
MNFFKKKTKVYLKYSFEKGSVFRFEAYAGLSKDFMPFLGCFNHSTFTVKKLQKKIEKLINQFQPNSKIIWTHRELMGDI